MNVQDHQHHDHQHHDHGHHPHHHVHFDTPEMAAQAELEGDVLLGLVEQATAIVAEVARREGTAVRRVLDLGSGPGVGSCQLAMTFDSAQIVAADGAAIMLDRAAARARRLGLADRVHPRAVALPAELATLDRADVVWVSMALHHLGDEQASLAGIRDLVEPGGLLALVEFGDPMRVLPPQVDLGRPGIWDRLDTAWAAWFAGMRAELPGAVESDPYPAMLSAAGYEVVADQLLTLHLAPPLDEPARQLARRQLARAGSQIASYVDHADLAALEPVVADHGTESILHRSDAHIDASRHLYIGRVPA